MPKVIKKTVYEFNELPEDIQDEVVEKLYDINVDYEWWDMDGLLDLSKSEMKERKISKREYGGLMFSYDKLYFNIERGRSWYIQFERLVVNNENVFRKWLRIPKKLWEKVDYEFPSPARNSSTTIEFSENYIYCDFTEKQQQILDRAKEIFDDKIDEALNILEKQYNYLTSREAIVETIEANEYWFNENGDIEMV
jgi:hypothetical protein